MPTWRGAAIGVVAAGLVLGATPARGHADATLLGTSAAECGTGSWVAGTVDLCAGELVYRDYVYDDWGADDGNVLPRVNPQPNGSAFGAAGALPPAGDQTYPPGGDGNSADLVALRLHVTGGQLHVRFELNTLLHAGSTVAALAVDTDDDPSTGGGAWPGVADVRSAGWDVMQRFTAGDPATNRIEGTMPRPAGTRWRVQAVTAVGGPAGPVMNVAFRGPDEYGFWWDERQAAALRAGDVSAFGHEVDVADLTGGVTRRAEVGPGFRQRVYESAYTVPPGEGVSDEGVSGAGGQGASGAAGAFAQLFHFLGRYQPYGIYVPAQPGPHGVQLLLHGYLENHSGRLWFPTHGGAHMRQQLGEARNRILVAPLGRGWAGWYSGYSERDVLDVLDDVTTNYDVDPDTVFAGGLSMGGYGAYRLAALFPDRFAGLVSWVGFTGDCANGTPAQGQCSDDTQGAVGNALDLFGNLRHLPTAMVYVGNDELVWANNAKAALERFQALGYPFAWWFHPVAGHTLWTFLDEWGKESDWTASVRRVHDPARVTYRTDRALDAPELGIMHDRAYWVSEVRQRNAGWADVDVTSHGCGVTVPQVAPAPPGAGAVPVPWVSQGADVVGHDVLPAADRLEVALRNVASLTFDVGPACVHAGDLAYHVDTDGPATIHLTDGRALEVAAAGSHDGILAGVKVLAAGTDRATATRPASSPLPATGGPDMAAAGLLLVAMGLTIRRKGRPASSGGGVSFRRRRTMPAALQPCCLPNE